jgi:hypothetical protein
MRTLYLILIIFICSITYSLAYTHIEVPLIVGDELGGRDSLVFGLDKMATDNYDSALGEIDAPRFPPPDEFLAAFEIFDSLRLMELVWSYKDFRPIKDTLHFFVKYSLHVNRSNEGKLVIFQWDTLPKYIDSAKITDRIEDLDLVDFNMSGTKRRDTVPEEYIINDFYVKVWYNNPYVSVKDVTDFSNLVEAYPNPVTDILTIKVQIPDFNYTIYSYIGEEIIRGVSSNFINGVDVSSLANGLYYCVITSGSKRCIRKFIKI